MIITVNGANISEFIIVRPHYNSSYLTQVEMEKLIDEVYAKTGVKLTIEEDAYVAETKYEIVVGNNNRNGVEKIADHDEYRIKISGTKVYLNGGSPHATAIAVTEFAKLIANGAVTDADSVVGSYKKTVASYDNTKYYVHKWGDDFDGDTVDPTKWDVIEKEQHYGKGAEGRIPWRVADHNEVKNGCLYQYQSRTDDAYYGGTVRTNNHMKFMGGYLEHSLLMSDNPMSWNTLWIHGAESNGVIGPEMDLNETMGMGINRNGNVHTQFNLHTWPAENNEFGWKHRSFDSLKPVEKNYKLPEDEKGTLNSTGFHTFGFLWTKDYVAGIFDGKIFVDMNLNEEGLEDFKMAFSTVACKLIAAASPGVGSRAADISKPEDWTHEKSDYITDYVHIYQLDDGWSRLEVDY